MRDDDSLPVSTPTSTSSSLSLKKEITATSTDHFFCRGRYKFWALAAILLLAFWSMLTGTVTLRWSAANQLNNLSDLDSFPLPDDLDVLEMEEREKLVRHMWDVYTSSNQRIRLAKFWEDAFKSAYEDMSSDVAGVRDAAVSEIAKMSLRSIHLVPSPPTAHSLQVMAWEIKKILWWMLIQSSRGVAYWKSVYNDDKCLLFPILSSLESGQITLRWMNTLATTKVWHSITIGRYTF